MENTKFLQKLGLNRKYRVFMLEHGRMGVRYSTKNEAATHDGL